VNELLTDTVTLKRVTSRDTRGQPTTTDVSVSARVERIPRIVYDTSGGKVTSTARVFLAVEADIGDLITLDAHDHAIIAVSAVPDICGTTRTWVCSL
jgi:hypothetical protein